VQRKTLISSRRTVCPMHHPTSNNITQTNLTGEQDCYAPQLLLISAYLYAILHFPSDTNNEIRMSEPSKNNYSKSSGKSVATQKVLYLLTSRRRYLLTADSNTNPCTSILCASMTSILLSTERTLNRFPEHGETRIQLGKVSLPKDVISSVLLT
jgi:hypothetical protein